MKEKGIFAFICSNKFAKAKYGEKLRRLILENQLKIYNDFTGVKIFKEAQVDTCVIQLKKEHEESNEIFVNQEYYLKQNRLENNSFTFNPPEILDLKNKIIMQGELIKNLDITINYGIKTGFNKAFIIDETTKNNLIKLDSKNKEIIKPLLRGRDIRKWSIRYQNLYLLYIPWNFNIKNYPSLKEYLQNYKEELSNRPEVKKEKYDWYCLSRYASDYVDLFEKEKLIYPNMASGLYPVYDDSKFYTNQKCFILTSNSINLKYLNGLLASNVLNFIFSLIGSNLGSNGYDLNKIFIEKLPIKITKNKIELTVINQVDTIIELYEKLTSFEEIIFNYLELNLNINLSNKLEFFYNLSEAEFLAEVKKKNNIFDENDLLKKFNFSKSNIEFIYSEINNEIKKLNEIIYEIYNLNSEEIKIIEDNI